MGVCVSMFILSRLQCHVKVFGLIFVSVMMLFLQCPLTQLSPAALATQSIFLDVCEQNLLKTTFYSVSTVAKVIKIPP